MKNLLNMFCQINLITILAYLVKEENEIAAYIRQSFDLQSDILLQELLREFRLQ